MARYTHHGPCPSCGSRDNLAHYDDGSAWCFGCSFYKPSNISGYVLQKLKSASSDSGQIQQSPLRLPPDATTNYGQSAVAWAGKYEIGVLELLRAKNPVVYSPSRDQLIFTFYDDNKNLLAWQSRNLAPGTIKKKRYFTQGDINSLLPIYPSSQVGHYEPKGLVLVEDCLSAIKVSNAVELDAMPLLGSDIPQVKLSRLRPFYSVLKVFLDPDMYHKAMKIKKRAELLGFDVGVVTANHDPKECSYNHLKELLT